MYPSVTMAFILVCVFLSGCVGSGSPTALTAMPRPKSGTIRVAFPTAPDTGDVPSLMAHQLLQAEGYTIQPTFFANPDIAVAALTNGEMDIGNGSTRTHWAAVAKGAEFVMLMEQQANVWSLVTRPELTTCAHLHKRNIAVNSAGSISKALLDVYLKQNCPDVVPNVLYISGSDNRSVALQAGQLDGTLLEVADILELEKQSPGRYLTLINYATALPKLKIGGVYVTRNFAARHPEIVRDYLRAVLTAHRRIKENPQLLRDALVKHLALDPVAATVVANTYLARNIWDVNGGMSSEDVQYSLDFFAQMASLPAGLNAARVSDASYLDQVLKEIGRK